MRYTLDGSEPTAQSTLYTDTIRLDKDAVIQAVAIRPEGLSEVSREEIKLSDGKQKK